MSADEEMEDFFAELRNQNSYLAPTFYTSVGIVATLVIIIIIMIIGYCYFARYLVTRNRLMNRKVKLLTSPQDDDIIELEVKNTTKSGSVDHSGEEDNVKEQQAQQQRLSQESEAAELSGKDTDTTPLIQETDGEAPNQNQTIDTEQMKNIPEGMYANVNKDAKTENGVAHDMTVSADVAPSMGRGIIVSDEDYAEVKCEHNTAYTYQPEVSTKDRSRTLPCTATVDIDLENEDYSRLVHDTQPNPRLSMPLLSDYSQIGMGVAKWHSLEMELDQNQNLNEDLYATPNPKNRLDHENRNDTPGSHCDTPSPLPTPEMDVPEKVLGLGSQESRPSGQKQGKELDNEMISDVPKGESPPPLPPPYLDGELEEASEALYDQAMNHYQNLSSCIESGNGNIGFDGIGGLNNFSKDVDTVATGIMNTENLQEGIYDSIDQGD